MFLKLLIFVLLPSGYLLSKTEKCSHVMNSFSSANTDFAKCILHNNENATFCMDCAGSYSRALFFYKELSDEHNESCRSRFFEGNQLHIFEKMMANVQEFWALGFCADCFVAGCDFTNITAPCPYSDHTTTIIQHHYETDLCINSTKSNNSSCTECEEKYTNFSRIYNDIRLKTGDKFCFAIKDMMNKTQIRWSKDLHCCEDRKSSLLAFLTFSGSTIFVSILFYISIYLFGLRSERIQYIPDDLMPSNHENDQSNGTIMNINHSEPSTSKLAGNDSKIAELMSKPVDSSSSDDELLTPSNPNLIQI